jgi:glycosyltransferase involved in cell wall biosynthesis
MPPPRGRRFLFVAHAFPPDSHAGVELYTLRLARGLAARGHRVDVVTSRQRPGLPQYATERLELDGVTVHGLVQNWPYRDLPEAVIDPAIDRLFGALLDELRPDLVSIQTLACLSAGIPGVCAERGIPAVAHLHDAWWSCPSGGQRLHFAGRSCLPVDRTLCGACFDRHRHLEGPLERIARRIAGRLPGPIPPDALHRSFAALPDPARQALRRLNRVAASLRPRPPEAVEAAPSIDRRIERRHRTIERALGHLEATFSPTRFLLDSLQDDGLLLPAPRVLASGVPHGGPATRLDAQADGPLRVLFAGTWVHHKGPQVLARALARCTTPIEARAVGPAPFPEFRDQVEALADGRLRVGPAAAPDEVPALLDATEVLVVPSTWAENAPLIALEARARLRPVIASDLGGLPEVVRDGVDGRLFGAGDADALARLLDDTAGLRALGATVRPPKSVATLVDEVEAAYEELLT